MTMNTNRISIITPLYEGKRYIEAFIDRVLRNQECLHDQDPHFEIELIFINDSPWEKITLPEKIEKLRYIVEENKSNQGIHKSRVRGLEYSTGKFIVFLDQDDIISDHYVLSQIRQLGTADAVICNGYKEHSGKKRIIYKDPLKMSLVNRSFCYLMAANQIVSPGQCMIKRDAIPEEWSKLILHNNGSDDLFLWLLFLQKGRRFALNKDRIYVHSGSGSHPSDDLKQMCCSDKEMCFLLREHHLIPDRRIRMRERLCRYIKDSGYKSYGSLIHNLRYPEIALVKAFAYYL